ncbi:hypothetical protein NUU61_000758 [Penicillium alfredii]|uniref:Uncharacterized protein n=1 Tax=Penicillium alfredii TaxID=1506179 RepID=A0A9W9GA78_9EURO|nr:uncharacterized protein NUU61_000758 [Penicillium alfredii]KAJ5114999.1 hypothetical protein NUU61_000758 [Penicillium alfredii]
MSFRVHHNTLTLLAAPVNETENVPTVSASLRQSPSWPWMYAMAWASDVPGSLDEWPCLVWLVCRPFSTTMSSPHFDILAYHCVRIHISNILLATAFAALSSHLDGFLAGGRTI